jgi:hypothetical protein
MICYFHNVHPVVCHKHMVKQGYPLTQQKMVFQSINISQIEFYFLQVQVVVLMGPLLYYYIILLTLVVLCNSA